MRLRKKLAARRGVTLTEMLTALAVLGLLTLVIAVGTGASLRVYRQSVAFSEAETLTSTLAQAVMDELRYAREISGSDAPTFTSAAYGTGASFAVNEDGHVTVKGMELVGSGAYGGFRVSITVAWQDGLFRAELFVLDGDETVQTAAFSVRPLNGL